MIKRACPFAPDAIKPETIPVVNNTNPIKRWINRKTIALFMSLLALTLVYSINYSELNLEGSSVLFQDWYIVKMSLYSYVMGLITYFIRKNRQKTG